MLKVTSTVLFLILCTPSLAIEYAKAYIPTIEKVGGGKFSYLAWDVYDAHLYAPNGKWQPSKPFALTLSYLRDIKGSDIVDSTIDEIRKQGYKNTEKLNQWQETLQNIFPNVTKGTVLTGVYTNEGYTVFYHNGRQIGQVRDREFSKRFFDIWLSWKTTAPNLRLKLLGQL